VETTGHTGAANETSTNRPGPEALEKPIRDVEPEMPPSTPAKPHPRNDTWSELMKRVFRVDVLQCEICGGAMKILATIHPPDTTQRILECLRLPARPPPLAPAPSDVTFQID